MSTSVQTLQSCTDSRPTLTLLTTVPGTRVCTSSRSHCTMSWPLLASSVGTLHAQSSWEMSAELHCNQTSLAFTLYFQCPLPSDGLHTQHPIKHAHSNTTSQHTHNARDTQNNNLPSMSYGLLTSLIRAALKPTIAIRPAQTFDFYITLPTLCTYTHTHTPRPSVHIIAYLQ